MGNMYPPHHLGGYELTWQSSVAHLRGAGHAVRVLTTDYRSTAVGPSVPEPEVHRELRWYWHDHGFPPLGMAERVRLERHNGHVVERHLADLKPDVVAWWSMGGMSLSLIERVRRHSIPAVGVVGDEWMTYGLEVDAWTRAARHGSRLERLAGRLVGLPTGLDLGRAARWLFVSDYVRRRSIEVAGELPDTEIAHPGVDPAVFAPAPERDWRGRLLYVGRLDERKGIATALEALKTLPAAITLEVVGEGDRVHARSLRQQAASDRLQGRVAFSGLLPQSELAAVYAEADALVFPVVWPEPWGLVPLEAMACGTPVLATGTGGSAEYLRHGHNCLLFEPGDADGLSRTVTRLAEDAEERAHLRAGGLATAARHAEGAYNRAIEEALLDVSGLSPDERGTPRGAPTNPRAPSA